MTVGSAMLLLYTFDTSTPPALRFMLVFGRVPLFYYALHAFLIHWIAIVICYARYGQIDWMFESPAIGDYPVTSPPGWGLSLWLIYVTWILVVLALYPVCRWYSGLKHRHQSAWLSYL